MARQPKKKTFRIFLKPINIRTHRHGLLTFRWLASSDVEFLSEQLSIDQSPRDFTALFLHHQLISPDLHLEAIGSLQDRSLVRIAWIWARHRNTIEKHLPEGTEPFEGFRTALKDYLEEERQQLEETMRRFVDSSFIKSSLGSIDNIQRVMGSQIIQQAKESASSLARIFDTIRPAESLARMAEDQRKLIEQVWSSTYKDVFQSAASITAGIDLALDRHIAEVTQISRIAEQTLAGIPWENINRATGIPFDIGIDLRGSFIDFSQSFNALSESLPQSSQFVLSHKPEITRLPAVEYLYGSNLFETILVEEPRDIPEEREKYQAELITETEDVLYVQLRSVDSKLVRLWEGARLAVDSDNPDKARHATVSMRELLTHIIHTLAPDEEIRQWTSDPAMYDKEKPTRRARLLYICRHVNYDPFTKFVNRDVDSMIEVIALLQRLHQLEGPFDERQLKALRARVEGLLRFLLEIAL